MHLPARRQGMAPDDRIASSLAKRNRRHRQRRRRRGHTAAQRHRAPRILRTILKPARAHRRDAGTRMGQRIRFGGSRGRKKNRLRAMAEEKLDVVGCGSMVVDLFYRTPRIIRADEKILLRAHTASAFATIFVDANGERAIYMARGATGELTPTEVRNRHGAFIRRANLVSTEISQLPIRTVLAILLFARTHSIPTVLDVDVTPSDAIGSLGTRAELERALKLATYLKPAKAAAREIVTGNGRDPLKMAEAIRTRYGNRAVMITDGDKGCAIAARETSIRVPAFKVKQIDSTGAGDAFLAGVFAGLRFGIPWDKIGRLANV